MELKRYLIQAGFKNSMADTSLFILNQQGLLIYVLVYVDDIIVTGSNKAAVEAVITNLAQRFSVKDMGVLSYFLGIEVIRTSKGLHLNQRKYILDLLAKMNMTDAKPVQTPMATSPKLTKSGALHSNPTEYRTLIGSLQYLSFTRPDIAYVVNKLSQYMQSPTTDHWQAAKRVLRYLAGSATHGLFISKSNNLNVHGFTDADWGGDHDDYVSTNAYIVYLGDQPISWQSRKQKGVARSSTEAEYRAVANTAAEIRWVCSLLSELGIAPTVTPVIYCDNIGATYLCANPVFHSRMKHIALDYHFIREQVQNGTLRVSHISTHDQLADSLTKPLDRSRFQLQRSKIGVSQAPPS
uniref:Retrovirus-related Pol polyprotein from transposon TNT 1-94 n=1 Tax=Noccaea caerulescens TaxID=107243 RepID=A0A1J3JSN7_NOCCA